MEEAQPLDAMTVHHELGRHGAIRAQKGGVARVLAYITALRVDAGDLGVTRHPAIEARGAREAGHQTRGERGARA